MPALTVSQLCKSYATAAGKVEILRNLDLCLEPGDGVAVTGPSGSGKSTLLYILGTLERPTSGTVELLGQQPFQWDDGALAAFRNRQIGFVFQDHHLLPQCTVLENVLLPLLAGAGVDPAHQQRARDLLDRVGLTARIDHLPAQLSGGERQRVAICRALICAPAVVLADEPTGNLDRETAQGIGTLLLEVCRDLRTILVVVTHSQELAARCPRHLALREGRLEDVTRST